MNRKQKIIVSITGIFIVLLALIGLTYAYFLTRITGNENDKSISVTTANLQLVYNDGTDGIIGGENLIPSDTEYSKTFTVKNEGNANIEYGVYLINVINEFTRKDDIKYTMECSTDGTLPCGTKTSTSFPSGIHQVVTASIEPNKTHTYTFTFTYKDTGTDQSVDMGKELNAKIQIFEKLSNGEYFPYEEGTLAYNVINNVKNGTLENKSVFTPNLNAVGMVDNITTADDKILSTAEDDYGTSYYFRGAIMDNYVTFADMCWRIVRIQGDGTTKLILASELTCNEQNVTPTSGYITTGERGTRGTVISGNYGYKYIGDSIRYDYINATEAHDNSARVLLNNWLNSKFISNELELLKNEQWCIGDLTNKYLNGTISENSEYYVVGDKFYNTKTPSYICPTTGKDGEIDINNVGMLTMDEVVYAGGGNKLSTYYIYDNALLGSWQLLSPSFDYNEKYTQGLSVMDSSGTIEMGTLDLGPQIRASITLKANVKVSDGVGTINNPYIIEVSED